MQDNILFTPHFALLEFTESATARKYGIDNTPTPEIVENIRSLCVNTLEPLREELGQPVIITSGYRCKALNERHQPPLQPQPAHDRVRGRLLCGSSRVQEVQGSR